MASSTHSWELRSNSSVFISSNQRILLLLLSELLRCPGANFQQAFMCLWVRTGFCLTTLQWGLFFCKVFLSPQRNYRAIVTTILLFICLTKAFLLRLLSLVGQPDIGRLLVVSNFRKQLLLGTLNVVVSRPVGCRSMGIFLDLMTWFSLR